MADTEGASGRLESNAMKPSMGGFRVAHPSLRLWNGFNLNNCSMKCVNTFGIVE
ncbi:MAG: hypothetical protein ACXWE3_12070 [Methylobacter sp.]